MNETHDPDLTSWVASANVPDTDFPIQNLPFGVFRRSGTGEAARVGIAIGDSILDVIQCARAGVFEEELDDAVRACAAGDLNELMALGREPAARLRERVSALLRSRGDMTARHARHAELWLVRMADAEMFVPARVGDYTDFYASVHHATNVGSMFRPDNPLLPNYKWVPIGYHGRASSIVPSGTPVRRPHGQTRAADADAPSFGPCRLLDYEAEMGAWVCGANGLGERVPIAEAERRLFGLGLVNDWSARDIQTWEYQPLGPFLAKSFATTVSPWVVTLDALEPFRVPAYTRPAGDPAPLPYLSSAEDRERGGFGITMEVWLVTARMRSQGIPPARVSRAGFEGMYWTFAQMVAHHTSNGCNLQPGDLLASGTVSGVAEDARGCLLERTWRGTKPLELPGGETRRFLEDGDEVIMRAYAEREGARRIGFGECRGVVLAAGA
ncbi:MAG TPA: fumarylacetoacetase [Gemmatimonadaceae bacterium]